MDQAEFTRLFCERPPRFAWFLGAGASHNANLPTAEDIITDLKRRFYSSEENQTLSTKDLQNNSVRETVESFMRSRGFPDRWAPDEYTTYFETIFGEDKERQRKYIAAILSDERVRLAVGNRVFGALLVSGLCRVAFTTNFDPVVEKSVAEIAGQSLSAYHIEGAHNANAALLNEEYPLYCKLHGDFRYDTIKNLSSDLKKQNEDLSRCMTTAAGRFGFVVAGYSGRDESIIRLFESVLAQPNPFPHGLYWMKLKGTEPLTPVAQLIEKAQSQGVAADFVDIETYDTAMLRIWRNLSDVSKDLDKKVRKGTARPVSIPVPGHDGEKPILRLNALPIVSVATHCASVRLKTTPTWERIKAAQKSTESNAVLTLGTEVFAWADDGELEIAFGDSLDSFEKVEFDPDWRRSGHFHFKRFLEDGLGQAFVNSRPLLMRRRGASVHLIVDQKATDVGLFESLHHECGKTTGLIHGLSIPETDKHPAADKVHFAEAVSFSLAYGNDQLWMLLNPDVWIWPAFARRYATDWLDKRKADRRNDKYDRLISAWVSILSDGAGRNEDVRISLSENKHEFLNPAFVFSTRTGFSLKRGRK